MIPHPRNVILCAEEIGNCAAGSKDTLSEVCIHHWQSIKTKLFSCLTNRKSFFWGGGPKKGINPETDDSALRAFQRFMK
jgi:hypothetical protein